MEVEVGPILGPGRKIWIEVCTVFSILPLTKDPLFDFCATSGAGGGSLCATSLLTVLWDCERYEIGFIF